MNIFKIFISLATFYKSPSSGMTEPSCPFLIYTSYTLHMSPHKSHTPSPHPKITGHRNYPRTFTNDSINSLYSHVGRQCSIMVKNIGSRNTYGFKSVLPFPRFMTFSYVINSSLPQFPCM